MLTDREIRALKPRDSLYRVADAAGLCIEVTPTDSKLWRYRYRHLGMARMVSLGKYPSISLADARRRRDEAHALLRSGKDPSAERAAEKDIAKRGLEASFPAVAAAWLDFKKAEWASETSRKARNVTDT